MSHVGAYVVVDKTGVEWNKASDVVASDDVVGELTRHARLFTTIHPY